MPQSVEVAKSGSRMPYEPGAEARSPAASYSPPQAAFRSVRNAEIDRSVSLLYPSVAVVWFSFPPSLFILIFGSPDFSVFLSVFLGLPFRISVPLSFLFASPLVGRLSFYLWPHRIVFEALIILQGSDFGLYLLLQFPGFEFIRTFWGYTDAMP